MPILSRMFAAGAVLAIATVANTAIADPLVLRPGGFPVVGVSPAAPPPYAPGFDRGVIVGARPDGCVTRTCRNVGGLQNRPFHRGYYRNYFELSEPRYGGNRPVGGNRAFRGAAALGDGGAAWCAARYRTYRPSDNTFQPNSGPRRQCMPRPD